MKNQFQTLIALFLIGVFFTSCNSQQKEYNALIDAQQKFQTTMDKTEGLTLHKSIQDYIKKYPTDTNIPNILFSDAKLLITGLSDYGKGIEQLQKIYTQYPTHPVAPLALQMEAFVYDETLKNLNMAKEKYTELIAKYPEHKSSEEAKLLLELLGKDLNSFLQKLNGSDSTTDKKVVQ